MNRLIIATVASTLICVLAWVLPERPSYTQFTFAILATVVSVGLLIICLCPQRKRRPLTLRLMAVGMGLSVGLGIWELVAMAWPTDHLADNPWYLSTGEALAADRDLPWVRPPNLLWTGSSRGDLAIETNSTDPAARIITFQTDFEGFRNSRDLTAAEIIFIGDSFTEAGNVPEEETFVSIVGSDLGVAVRNMGVAGYGSPSELIALQKYGLKCRPRTVVWQIAETNDLDDAVNFVQWQQAGRPNVLPGFSKSKPSRLEAWQRRSPTQLLYGLLHREEPWPFRGEFIDRERAVHTIRFEMSFPPDALHHPGWPVIEHTLVTGAEMLKTEDIRLVVMLIPRKVRVMAPSCDIHKMELTTPRGPLKLEHTLPQGWDLEPEARLATHLEKLCDRLEVDFVNTTAGLKKHAAAGELVYQAMDTHLSPVGHEIVAKMIVQTLESSGSGP